MLEESRCAPFGKVLPLEKCFPEEEDEEGKLARLPFAALCTALTLFNVLPLLWLTLGMEYLARLLLLPLPEVLEVLPWAPLATTPPDDFCPLLLLPPLLLLKWYKAALEDMAAGRCGFFTKNLTAGEFLLKAPVVLKPLAFVWVVPVASPPLLGTGGLLLGVAKCAGAVRCPFGGVWWKEEAVEEVLLLLLLLLAKQRD